jgi:hypothetical protein
MTFALPFLTGFALGAFAVFALVVLLIVLANRGPSGPGAEISTHGDDDFLAPYVAQPHPSEDIAQGEGIAYRFLGATGFEED